jgi:hypothetical protein
LWYARSLATRSVESFAAFRERVLGIVKSADANSAMASCSLEPYNVSLAMRRRRGAYEGGSKVLEVD